MRRTPLFLPLTYVTLLLLVSMGGFIALGSFTWLIGSAVLGFAVLRGVAGHDPRLIDVFFIAQQKTPVPASWFQGRGIVYRA